MMPYSLLSFPFKYASSGIVVGSSVLVGTLLYLRYCMRRESIEHKNYVVLITGCDSGLGYSLASHCRQQGLSVLAGCLNKNSEGALDLEEKGAFIIELDLTKFETVQNALKLTRRYMELNRDKEFRAIVNNAAVMCFGEFEWLTKDIISHEIQVNLTGTLLFTNVFSSLVRNSKARIINITSHCADACLPGLSVYGATKAGLKAWNDALRVELKKFGVDVILFLPGAFFGQSNILANQEEKTIAMKGHMQEDVLEYYQDYFERYFTYIHSFSKKVPLHQIENAEIYTNFDHAIFSDKPKFLYKISPFRYSVYHLLFNIMPTKVRDILVENFVSMPRWKE